MSGLAWVKVASDLSSHPKTRALAHRTGLSVPAAVGVLAMMWGWFGRFNPDGSAPDNEDTLRSVEAATEWPGESGKLFEFLTELGFLERRRRRVLIHNWDKWSGTYEAEKQRDRERKRVKRAEERGERPADVRRRSDDSPGQKKNEKENQNEREAATRAHARDGGGDLEEQLERFAKKLAAVQGLPQVSVGSSDRVRSSFRRWFARGLEEALIEECTRLAREKGVTPGSLLWWCGWIDTVPNGKLDDLALQQSARVSGIACVAGGAEWWPGSAG